MSQNDTRGRGGGQNRSKKCHVLFEWPHIAIGCFYSSSEMLVKLTPAFFQIVIRGTIEFDFTVGGVPLPLGVRQLGLR
jgi:hypothetical protein